MKLFGLKYIPLTIIVGFNLFTLFIFYTAPMRWATNNLLLFLFFSLSCQILIAIGYRLGFKKSSKRNISNPIFSKFSNKKLHFVFYFYTLTFLIKYAYHLKLRVLDIQGMFNLLMIGIANPQLGYAMSLNDATPYVSWTIYLIISVIDLVFFIIGFIKWRNMGTGLRVLFSIFILIDLFYWMGLGTNFGVIKMVTTLVFASIYRLRYVKLNFKKVFLFYSGTILLLAFSIFIFSYNMNNRVGNVKIDFQSFNLGLSKVDENNTIFKILPKGIQQSYLYIVSYLTQGYYHTCLAFDLDFKSTFFLGNNPAIVDLAKIFNIDVWPDTYMYRLSSKGVDPLARWHSAYLWYASDVSFYGVPFLLGFMGYLFGFSWGLILKKNDFLSKIVFIIFGNMLLFLFANNSYLSSVFYSFMFILPIWYLTRVMGIKLVNK